MSGWLKFYRKIWDHPKSNDPDFMWVWMWMLSQADYSGRKVMFMGREYQLKSGQFTAGRRQISLATGVHESKVNRTIKWLKSEHQIEQQATRSCSLFTILNWERYQSGEQPSEQKMNNSRTSIEQQPNTKQEGKKERKQENKKNTPPSPLKGEEPNGSAVKRKKATSAYQEHFSEHWPEISKHKPNQSKTDANKKWQLCLKAGLTPEQIMAWQRGRLALRPSEEHKYLQGFQFAAKPEDIKDWLETEGQTKQAQINEKAKMKEAIRIAEAKKAQRIQSKGVMQA